MSEKNQHAIDQMAIDQMAFEQAYQELEETVQKLEAGDLPLAEALSLYQKGMALAQHCGIQLDQAELSIQALTPAGDLVDFEAE
jgi:exodeoxyribonuclease VII small subunit